MKIIAATDFSAPATGATRTAARLARKVGGSLVLVRVIEPPAMLYPELAATGLEAMEAALRPQVEAQMKAAAAALSDEGVPVESRVLWGVPDQAIASCAAEEGAQLIVMGTHGRRAAARLLLGSVAERTVLAASCPVLVLREGSAPFDDWVKNSRPLRVVAGVDLSVASEAALAFVRTLRQLGPCDVTLVHDYWPPREYARLGLQGPRNVFETDAEVVQVLERELRAHIGELTGEGRSVLRVRAAWGRPGEALALEAESEHADVLVVGTHQPHGWERLRLGSAALSTIRATNVPVLCVPEKLRPAPTQPVDQPIPMLRRVLAPTDFSESGNAAVLFAYGIVRGSGGVVELCHVHERVLPTPLYAYEDKTGELSTKQRAEIDARLRALIPAGADKLGITTHVTVIDGGSTAEALVQAANRLGVDAVCLASHGRSGVAKAFLGSVAEAVLRRASRPVFVVRTGGH